MPHFRRQGAAAALLGSVLLLALVLASSSGAASRTLHAKGGDQSDAVHYDTSPPLASMSPAPAPPLDTKKEHPQHKYPTPDASTTGDPVVQSNVGAGHRLRVYVPNGTHWYE